MQFGKRLGKRIPKLDHRTLRLSRYLPALPPPPPHIDHASGVVNPGMMGNDAYGDCGVAAMGHMVQSWTAYSGAGQRNIPDADILAAYFELSPNDQGIYLLDGLNYWRKSGVGGDNIEAFAATDGGNLLQAKLAIQMFGSAYIGMSLPDQNTFGPWTTVQGPPNPFNGHAVNLCAYDDARQMFKAITWGEVVDLSYAWLQRYCDEAYATLNDIQQIKESGLSPEGFDWARLENDLAHINDPEVPVVPVVPPAPTRCERWRSRSSVAQFVRDTLR